MYHDRTAIDELRMTIGDTFRHLGWPSADDPRPDAELVGRFVRHRDEPAFTELLRRHGPTVYGVCRRIVGHTHDADDAFQAVFLVLARKADTIRPPGMVGNWLYGVAVRTANKARVMNAKRIKRAATARGRESEHPLPSGRGSCDADTLELIDTELAALPDVYRVAFVACDLNGRSRSEAAKELGWPEGTLAARLMKARDLLAKRLTKRGVTLGAATLTTVSVPSALAAETLNAVRELVAVGAANAVAPAAQQLSDQVVNSMNGAIWKPAMLRTLFLGLTIGTTALVYAAGGEKPGSRPERKSLANAPVPKELQTEWTEQPSIELEGGGRITSVAYAPSGKVFAVCRDNGMIDFYDTATRKHYTSMNLGGDPKSNPNTEVGTITSIAFRLTPHAKLGDVFAVTHKHGVKIGTTDIGLMVDNGATVNDIPPNWHEKDYDPHQVVWIQGADGGDHLAVTKGTGTTIPLAVGKVENYPGWGRYLHKPTVLSPTSDGKRLLLRYWGTPQELTSDKFDIQMVTVDGTAPIQTLTGHKSRPMCGAVSKDAKLIVTGDEGGTLIVWEWKRSLNFFVEMRRIEQGPGLATLALAPDGKSLAVLRSHGVDLLGGPANRVGTAFELFVFDPTDPPAKPTRVWKNEKLLPGKLTGPVSLAFSPDGSTLLAAFGDPYPGVDAKLYGADMQPKKAGVRVWSLGRKRNAPVPEPAVEWKEAKSIDMDGKRVTSVAYSPDGKTIAVAQDGGVSVIDAAKRTVIGPTSFGDARPSGPSRSAQTAATLR